MIKINLGSGKRNFGKDWIHIDIADYPHIKYKNIFDFPLKNVDLIYASHLIEYFNREDAIKLLKYLKKKLKYNGILRLAVPNFEIIAELYHLRKYELDSFLGPMYGMMKVNSDFIYHKTIYDFTSLSSLLKSLGYREIRKWDHNKVDHGIFDDHSQAYLPHMDKKNGVCISLNVECLK